VCNEAKGKERPQYLFRLSFSPPPLPPCFLRHAEKTTDQKYTCHHKRDIGKFFILYHNHFPLFPCLWHIFFIMGLNHILGGRRSERTIKEALWIHFSDDDYDLTKNNHTHCVSCLPSLVLCLTLQQPQCVRIGIEYQSLKNTTDATNNTKAVASLPPVSTTSSLPASTTDPWPPPPSSSF
jgi:hypothetical protein